jgi:hypothetical protein
MKVTICDVCGKTVGARESLPRVFRLRTAGEVHPHQGEPLRPQEIDLCRACVDRLQGAPIFVDLPVSLPVLKLTLNG